MSNFLGSAGILSASLPVLRPPARTPALPSSGSRNAKLESRSPSLSRFHPVEQETTEGTEIWEPVKAIVCRDAQTSPKRDSTERIGPGRGGTFYQFPLSPTLSPLVPRGEREQNPASALRAEHNWSVTRTESESAGRRSASCASNRRLW